MSLPPPYFLFILLLFVLSGCVTPNVSRNYAMTGNETTGLVIGSVTQDAGLPRATNAIFVFNKNIRGKHIRLRAKEEDPLFGSLLFESEFGNDNQDGRIFALEMPAGTHKLNDWRINIGNGYYYPRNPPPELVFTVKPGEIIYVGNLHMHLLKGKNLFGMTVTAGGLPEIKDLKDRDLALFKQQYTEMADADIRIDPLQGGFWITDLAEIADDLIIPVSE